MKISVKIWAVILFLVTGVVSPIPGITFPVHAEVTIGVPMVDLPKDELPHPGVQVEWWYYSGHLEDTEGRGYGVMASFFVTRMGNFPASHFMIYALTEKTAEKFHSGSIIQKGMIDMMKMVVENPPAGLKDMVHPDFFDLDSVEEYHTIMKNKPVVMKDKLAIKYEANFFRKIKEEGRDFKNWKYRTKIVGDGFGYELSMTPTRGPMYAGGVGNVGLNEDEDMFYYSFTRLDTDGVITVDGEEREVSGTLWYDHQYGSLGSPDDPVGWDWFCIQLEDGMDLNISSLRRLKTGERFNRVATVRRADGRVSVVKDLVLETLGSWESPDTGIVYPVGWKLALPSLRAEFTVKPVFNEQEMRTFGPFQSIWEGACTVEAVVDGEALSGDGYTELVGYAYTPNE